MENYPYSYPDSHDSSPRSLNNESWDDQQPAASQKVKFMISYNGKILPRPHDNQLTYVGGETKILALDRTIRFSAIVSKLSSFTSDEITFKYQLPGEDLDALISVTNDEDLEHMMAEYDRLHRSSGGGGSKPARLRLRLFLFPVSNSNQSSFSGDDPKPNQQWFVDALNAVPVSVPPIDASSPPASASNPSDLLFGFEKQPVSSPSPVPVSVPVSAKQDVESKVAVGSDSGSERGGGGDPMYEMHRQIQDLQRLQIQEQKQQQQQLQQQLQQAAMFQRSNEGNINLARANYDYYMPEKPAAAASVPVTVAPAGYWQDRNTAVSGGYSNQINSIERQQQQQQQVHQQQQQQAQQQQQEQQQQQQHQLYMISSQGYQTPMSSVRHLTGQVGHTGQGYYGVQMQQRVAQDVYREQPMYAMGPPQVQQQQQQQQHPQMKMMMGEVGGGGGSGGGGYTTQVGYDSTGRQVYYTTPSAQAGIGATYQTAVNVDPRQAGQLNQESKVVKPPQAS